MVEEKVGYKACRIIDGKYFSHQYRILPDEFIVEYEIGKEIFPPDKKRPLFVSTDLEEAKYYGSNTGWATFKVSYKPSKYIPAEHLPRKHRNMAAWCNWNNVDYADSLTIIEEIKYDE